jgi:hypothetical protein
VRSPWCSRRSCAPPRHACRQNQRQGVVELVISRRVVVRGKTLLGEPRLAAVCDAHHQAVDVLFPPTPGAAGGELPEPHNGLTPYEKAEFWHDPTLQPITAFQGIEMSRVLTLLLMLALETGCGGSSDDRPLVNDQPLVITDRSSPERVTEYYVARMDGYVGEAFAHRDSVLAISLGISQHAGRPEAWKAQERSAQGDSKKILSLHNQAAADIGDYLRHPCVSEAMKQNRTLAGIVAEVSRNLTVGMHRISNLLGLTSAVAINLGDHYTTNLLAESNRHGFDAALLMVMQSTRRARELPSGSELWLSDCKGTSNKARSTARRDQTASSSRTPPPPPASPTQLASESPNHPPAITARLKSIESARQHGGTKQNHFAWINQTWHPVADSNPDERILTLTTDEGGRVLSTRDLWSKESDIGQADHMFWPDGGLAHFSNTESMANTECAKWQLDVVDIYYSDGVETGRIAKSHNSDGDPLPVEQCSFSLPDEMQPTWRSVGDLPREMRLQVDGEGLEATETDQDRVPADQVPADQSGTAATASPSATPAHASSTFRVNGVASDDVLNMRAEPSGDSSKVVAIPFDAEGIVATGEQRMTGRTAWVPVRWGGHEGWVAARYIQNVDR